MLSKAYEPINDEFTFVVRTAEQKSAEQIFKISHVPGDTDVEITLERLEVEEGSKKALTEKYLRVEADDIDHFVFNVTRAPRHGRIDVLAPNKVINKPIYTIALL